MRQGPPDMHAGIPSFACNAVCQVQGFTSWWPLPAEEIETTLSWFSWHDTRTSVQRQIFSFDWKPVIWACQLSGKKTFLNNSTRARSDVCTAELNSSVPRNRRRREARQAPTELLQLPFQSGCADPCASFVLLCLQMPLDATQPCRWCESNVMSQIGAFELWVLPRQPWKADCNQVINPLPDQPPFNCGAKLKLHPFRP